MKVLYFGGGLGNQIFEYFFYLYLKNKYPKESIYGVYNKKKLSEHNGLEINKWFNVNLPISSLKSDFITYFFYAYKKIFGNNRFVDNTSTYCLNEQATVLNAFKYCKNYITKDSLKWNIDEKELSEANKKTLKNIRETNSFFIHIRRGDYLTEKYRKYYEDTCTIEYYTKAIESVLQDFQDAQFYIFSDDIAWTKENINIENAYYIDWNTGINSPLDMFLMSQCKGAIIANSTFSYWGAVLGVKKIRIYYPKKWINIHKTPDIFFPEWISF